MYQCVLNGVVKKSRKILLKASSSKSNTRKKIPSVLDVASIPCDLLTKSLHKGSRRIKPEDPLTPTILKVHSWRAIFQKWTTIRRCHNKGSGTRCTEKNNRAPWTAQMNDTIESRSFSFASRRTPTSLFLSFPLYSNLFFASSFFFPPRYFILSIFIPLPEHLSLLPFYLALLSSLSIFFSLTAIQCYYTSSFYSQENCRSVPISTVLGFSFLFQIL